MKQHFQGPGGGEGLVRRFGEEVVVWKWKWKGKGSSSTPCFTMHIPEFLDLLSIQSLARLDFTVSISYKRICNTRVCICADRLLMIIYTLKLHLSQKIHEELRGIVAWFQTLSNGYRLHE